MKKLLQKIWTAIKNAFNKADEATKQYVPIAINVVEGIKTFIDSPVDDVLLSVIKAAIPGTADDILIDKINAVVKEYLPKVLLDLKMVESIANIQDQNEQLKAILEQFKLSSDETKNIFYHGLSVLILEKLSDGVLSWSDAIAISEYYYQNITK